MESERSERVEEYLEAIYKRQQTESPVSTSSLAKDLEVSLPAITDMLHRLETEELIEYHANKGAILTGQGNERALSIIRRHRLWERFLTDILGMKWDEVHEEACRLEHATSAETERRMAKLLGDIDTCPHGNPIPDKDGNIKEQKIVPLSEFMPGQIARIITIAEETPHLTVGKKHNDTSVELEVAGKYFHLKKEIEAFLMAKPISAEEKANTVEETSIVKLASGESGVVKSYEGGRAMLGRCLSMGFTPGSLVKMIKNFGGGPVLVKVHDTEVAMGRGLAEKIIVKRNREKW
jgi:DtxR family Mn-dependent transcriptional regulator